MSNALQGRVFDRARRFEQLPDEYKAEVHALRTFLLTPDAREEVFGYKQGQGCMVKAVYSVEGRRLLTTITQYLIDSKAADTSNDHAKKLADGLVLTGFISPQKETMAMEHFAFDHDTFHATEPEIADPQTTSVWSVKSGAIQAGELKRKKTGLMSRLVTSTASVYVVANDKTHTVTVFDSDVARTPLATIDVSSATVEFDATITNGIKLSNTQTSEIFGAPTKPMQDEWLNSFINAGATYREAFNVDVEHVKSIYELKDYDMQGNEVSMDKYKGKVLLVVNVSSLCGLTPTNYPELAALDEKYRDQGLQILAFPCNQFASQEPGTHEEIIEFVKQWNCQFPFFEKHDVNGANARPVFTYLKSKLPGSFGSFVKWNFTKFLVDRNGQPFKRYAPKDLPFSFEEDIKTLLGQSVN